jgi:hypothetical protein
MMYKKHQEHLSRSTSEDHPCSHPPNQPCDFWKKRVLNRLQSWNNHFSNTEMFPSSLVIKNALGSTMSLVDVFLWPLLGDWVHRGAELKAPFPLVYDYFVNLTPVLQSSLPEGYLNPNAEGDAAWIA